MSGWESSRKENTLHFVSQRVILRETHHLSFVPRDDEGRKESRRKMQEKAQKKYTWCERETKTWEMKNNSSNWKRETWGREEDEGRETRANYLSMPVMTWKLKAASLLFFLFFLVTFYRVLLPRPKQMRGQREEKRSRRRWEMPSTSVRQEQEDKTRRDFWWWWCFCNLFSFPCCLLSVLQSCPEELPVPQRQAGKRYCSPLGTPFASFDSFWGFFYLLPLKAYTFTAHDRRYSWGFRATWPSALCLLEWFSSWFSWQRYTPSPSSYDKRISVQESWL